MSDYWEFLFIVAANMGFWFMGFLMGANRAMSKGQEKLRSYRNKSSRVVLDLFEAQVRALGVCMRHIKDGDHDAALDRMKGLREVTQETRKEILGIVVEGDRQDIPDSM